MFTNRTFRFLFVLVFLFVFNFTPKVFAATIIYDDILVDTTWTKENSPYIINTSVYVPPNITLTIEPGVVVKFDYGNSFFIEGAVNALGAEMDPIYFTSNYDDTVGGSTGGETFCYNDIDEEGNTTDEVCETFDFGDPIVGDWGGFYFFDSLDSDFKNVYIKYTDNAFTFQSSNVNFQNLNISESMSGVVGYNNSSTKIVGGYLNNIYDEVFTFFNNSSLVLDNVDFSEVFGFNVVSVFNDSSLDINGSSIVAPLSDGVRVFRNSVTTITDLSITCAGQGLEVSNNSIVSLSKSSVDCGTDGILLFNQTHALVEDVQVVNASGVGVLVFDNYDPNSIVVTDSKISENEYGFVVFDTAISANQNSVSNNNIGVIALSPLEPNQFDFTNNYWGDPSGPYNENLNPNGLGNFILDDVLFTPFLESDPLEVPKCCSSVLFLPGIKGSVLKKNSDTLWPPTLFSFNDVSQLALTNQGTSINEIHTDGIINTFYGTSIYAPFSNFMDNITGDDKLIKKWLPLAYDWRFSPETIIEDGIKTADETLDVVEEIETLAGNSKTGKITIISHSMGGLLGKAIIKKLQEEGKDSLIESFVMVGTPQLGTPQAIASMLHGDSEGILAGFIANPINMRTIAQNMPSAYNLLPSPRYFTEVVDPVIRFNSGASFTQAWRDFWGATIDTYSNFLSFVTGTGVTRNKPAENILRDPEVLQGDFLADAITFHRDYDNYQFPEHIRVVQVAGWGSPTVKAVEYKNSHGVPGYETKFTVEGDRTVVYPSAVSSVADETYFFDLPVYNAIERISNYQHRDLLNALPVQDLITTIIEERNISENSYIRVTKPDPGNILDQLVVSSHSPVILGAYDSVGNFTGIDPDQDLSTDILEVKEDIPGSTFLYTSESQYIFLPKDGEYNFIYKGTGSGYTTIVIENLSADITSPVVQYSDVPTTSSVRAEFTVNSSTPEETVVRVDMNGDGSIDETIYDDDHEFSLGELIAQLKEKISSLNAKDKLKKNLLKRIENLEKKIEKKKEKNAKILEKFKNKITKQEMKGKIGSSDVAEITKLLDMLEVQSESLALDSEILDELKEKITSLDIKQSLTKNLLKRVENLENKRKLIKTLSNLTGNIKKKAQKGKVVDEEAQAIINIFNQIESMI